MMLSELVYDQNKILGLGLKLIPEPKMFASLYWIRDHPFKTSACFRGGGVKNLPNLPTDSTKKRPTVGG